MTNPETPIVEEAEDEPFDLPLLNDDLQCLVVEKVDYVTFTHLRETSSHMNTLCGSYSFKLDHVIHRIEIREVKRDKNISSSLKILILGNHGYHGRRYRRTFWKDLDPHAKINVNIAEIHCVLTSEGVSEIMETFSLHNASVYSFNFRHRVECSPLEFSQLIKKLNCNFWTGYTFMRADFFTPDVMKTSMEVPCNFTDQQLLQWNGENMWIQNDSVSAKAINRLLREWAGKKREINHFVISFDSSRGSRDRDEIVKGLDANPVWTREHHELSEIGQIPIEELDMENMEDFYSLWRSEDIEYGRFLRISGKQISFTSTYHEKLYLRTYLNREQQERFPDE